MGLNELHEILTVSLPPRGGKNMTLEDMAALQLQLAQTEGDARTLWEAPGAQIITTDAEKR